MDEQALRDMIDDVKAGRMSRRSLRPHHGRRSASPRRWPRRCWPRAGSPPRPKAPRSRRPSAAVAARCKMLWWQAPTLLNPHFATGTKDQDASRIFYEPLAAYDPEGNLSPVLAAEVPSVDNGGLGQGPEIRHLEAQEGRQLARWQALHRRRRGLQLGVRCRSGDRGRHHRLLSRHRAGRASSMSHSVKVVFKQPTPFWSDAFCGRTAALIPKHLFEPLTRGPSRARRRPTSNPSAPAPTASSTSSRATSCGASINPSYHVANRPFFDTLRDEGRRRRRLGRTGGAPDGRVRLRLEHPGRGRHPPAVRAGRQGPGQDLAHREHRAHPVQLHRPLDARSTGSAPASRPPIPRSPIRPCGRP